MSDTRILVEASFAGSLRAQPKDSGLTAPSLAGMLLALSDGSTLLALALLPKDANSPFWNDVCHHITTIDAEERACATLPPPADLKTGT